MNESDSQPDSPAKVYLALGSNIRPEHFLPLAVDELSRKFTLLALSSAWKTPAVGFQGHDFLNAIVEIETILSPVALKFRILRPLEARLGRVRTDDKYASRTIDIDILKYDDQLLDKELWKQPHLAVPMAELAPTLTNPKTGKSIRETALALSQDTPILKQEDILAPFILQ